MYPSLKRSLVISVCLTLIVLTLWEMHCRSEGYVATQEDGKELWAEFRDKVKDSAPNQLIIVGASRGHFDFQLDEWEEASGTRPLMLSADGRGPAAVIEDIVEKTKFNGTLVVNVTPDLFFVPPVDSVFGWWRGKEWVDYYHKRTYAQIFNHQLSYLLQPYFSFLTSGEETDPDLKSMINDWTFKPDRAEAGVPFPRFAYVENDRNCIMLDKFAQDTAYAAIIQRAWMEHVDSVNKFTDHRQEIFDFYINLVKKLKDRGGKVIFTRNPSSGDVYINEKLIYPRKEWWDKFIQQVDCPGYYFTDYPQLNQFDPPEWSHLATPDARIYTKEIVAIFKKDSVL